jgi:uncharacterized protein (DUF2235 family)
VYAQTHGVGRKGHARVHFVGLWDTVEAAGTLTRQLRWLFCPSVAAREDDQTRSID